MMKNSLHIISLLILILVSSIHSQEVLPSEKLSDAQKQHAKIYYQINQQLKNNEFDFDKVFKAFYTPIVDDCERLYKENKKFEAFFREKANASMENNKQEIAKKQEKARECFHHLAQLTQTISEAYKKKESSKIDKSLVEYKQIERTLLTLGSKIPQRNWVTVSEAKIFVAQTMRNNRARRQK